MVRRPQLKRKARSSWAEQAALFPRLGGDAEDAAAAQALDALGEADLEILGPGVEGEQDGDLLALLERLAGGLGGGRRRGA